MRKHASSYLFALALLVAGGGAEAATRSVGPGQTYTSIMDAWNDVQPGDVIEVQGGQTYLGTFLLGSDHSGTADAPITLRGIPVNGQRPILKGIGPGMWDNMVVFLNADHFVMESFEVVGNANDTDYCLVHGANDVTLRDLVVHDCLHQAGLVSNDEGSGSITVEYSEFYWNGSGETSHQLYMATDQAMFPGSTFRMQYCYVHDGLGGNNVSSRAQRNEIYYNWIEGAYYHELNLIGPDVGGTFSPCNSDVVGNVFLKTSSWRIARVGGDAEENSSDGQYRFVNNTMILAPSTTAALTLQYTVASVEMYNNVIVAPTAGTKLYDIEEQTGTPAVSFGSNNWISAGMTKVPTAWTGTVMGADPGFVNASMQDFRPAASSPLLGAGTTDTDVGGSSAFPNPLALAAYYPPEHTLLAVDTATARTSVDMPILGALAPSSPAPGPAPMGMGGGPSLMTGAGAGGTGDGNGGNGSSGGCKCHLAEDTGGPGGWLGGLGLAALALGRRRPKARRRAVG
jgi:MYXO-CTERM domain-containing protein